MGATMTLNEWLYRYKLTAAEFARLSGISKATISRLLKGRSPSYQTACRINAATKGEVRFTFLTTKGACDV